MARHRKPRRSPVEALSMSSLGRLAVSAVMSVIALTLVFAAQQAQERSAPLVAQGGPSVTTQAPRATTEQAAPSSDPVRSPEARGPAAQVVAPKAFPQPARIAATVVTFSRVTRTQAPPPPSPVIVPTSAEPTPSADSSVPTTTASATTSARKCGYPARSRDRACGYRGEASDSRS